MIALQTSLNPMQTVYFSEVIKGQHDVFAMPTVDAILSKNVAEKTVYTPTINLTLALMACLSSEWKRRKQDNSNAEEENKIGPDIINNLDRLSSQQIWPNDNLVIILQPKRFILHEDFKTPIDNSIHKVLGRTKESNKFQF